MISGKIGKISGMLMIFILLCAFFTVTAVATSPPMMLQGNLLIDGEPAAVGTEVTVVVDGNVVSTTTVTKEGVFGDQRSNKLGIPSNNDVVSIYVNNVETQTLDMREYKNGDTVPLDLSAKSFESTEPAKDQQAGMGGGFNDVAAEEELDGAELADTTETESDAIFQSTPEDASQQTEDGEYLPMGSPSTNSMIIMIVLVLGGVIIAVYGYRSRK